MEFRVKPADPGRGLSPQGVAPQSVADLLGQFQQPGPQHLTVSDVLGKRRLVRDAFGFAVWNDRAIVDAVGEIPKVFARTAEVLT